MPDFLHLNHNKNPPDCSEITGTYVYRAGCEYIQEDSSCLFSKFSKYQQYQLFVILLYKAWRNASYRDVTEMISSNSAFIGLLSLSEMPHFTTIQKFSERIDKGIIAFVFNQVLKSFTESFGSRMIIDSTQ